MAPPWRSLHRIQSLELTFVFLSASKTCHVAGFWPSWFLMKRSLLFKHILHSREIAFFSLCFQDFFSFVSRSSLHVSSFGFFQLASLFLENIGFPVSLSWDTQCHCPPWGIKGSSALIALLVPDWFCSLLAFVFLKISVAQIGWCLFFVFKFRGSYLWPLCSINLTYCFFIGCCISHF